MNRAAPFRFAFLWRRRGDGPSGKLRCCHSLVTSIKYQDRPAAADIAFCVAAYGNGMTEDRIERALEDDYLPRIRCAPLRGADSCPHSKSGSPSADSFQSPWEWVATAHPPGKHVPQTADKPKETEPITMFNKVILNRPPRAERRSQNRSEHYLRSACRTHPRPSDARSPLPRSQPIQESCLHPNLGLIVSRHADHLGR